AGIGPDVEEGVGASREVDQQVQSEGVVRLGASAAAPVELLGDLAPFGIAQDESGTVGVAGDLMHGGRSGQPTDMKKRRQAGGTLENGVQNRRCEGTLHVPLETEPALSASLQTPAVVSHVPPHRVHSV